MSRTEAPRPRARFGIVIPVRHMADQLAGAIDSILSQEIDGRRVNAGDRVDLDLVVVVDDLDDATRAVLAGYGDALRWVEGDGRKQAGAVNKGLGLLNAEIVKWVNADDRLLPGALTAMDRAFATHPEAAFAYGDIVFLDAAETVVGEHLEPSYSPFILLYGQNLFADPACFWRADLHERIGPISEAWKYSLDFEFWARIVRHRVPVIQVPQRVAAFKVTGDNLSVVHHRAMRQEHFDIVAEHFPGWARVPRGPRNAILSGLLPLARIVKRLRVWRERGGSPWSGSRVFARLMSRPAGEPRPPGHD